MKVFLVSGVDITLSSFLLRLLSRYIFFSPLSYPVVMSITDMVKL